MPASRVHIQDGLTNPLVDPLRLSTVDQAVKLLSLAQRTFPQMKLSLHLDSRDGFPYVADPGEDRTLWMINDDLVGHLLKVQYEAGPGAILTAVGASGFTWKANPTGLGQSASPSPRTAPGTAS